MKLVLRNYSHIGKRLLPFSNNIDISLENVKKFDIPKFNRTSQLFNIVVSSPNKKLTFPLYYGLKLSIEKGKIPNENCMNLSLDEKIYESLGKYQKKFIKGMWGTTNSIVRNMVQGVHEDYQIPIRLIGVGYKFSVENNHLIMKLGNSHLDKEKIPENVTIKVVTQTKIICSSANYHNLTQFAAKIKFHKEPEPYNGKGIFVGNEKIMMKEGKKTGK